MVYLSDTSYQRKEWDSNPRMRVSIGGFQDRYLQPLGHPSVFLLVYAIFTITIPLFVE